MSGSRTPLVMPRVNANDARAKIVRWLKRAGEAVKAGELILQIETTKAAVDIEAPCDGYFHPLVAEGVFAPVGNILAWIAATYDPNTLQQSETPVLAAGNITERLISMRARAAMEKAGLTAEDMPGTGAIDLRQVEQLLAQRQGNVGSCSTMGLETLPILPASVILYGAAEQGLVVLDALQGSDDHVPLCFVDDAPRFSTLGGLPVFVASALERIVARGVRSAHICIGAPAPKRRVAERLDALGFRLVNAIHPRAVIASTAQLGRNVYVGPGAIVGPEAAIGDFCQINNNATVPHHVQLGWGVRVSDGANIAGGVVIGDRAYLGLGVTINTGCHIGADATLVSGVSVFNEIPAGATVRTAKAR